MVNVTGILTRDRKEDMRTSAEDMDEERRRDLSYHYLCHLEEAKKWMEACLREPLPPSIELEENLRNGVYLAKLGNFMAPNVLPLNKIYDTEQRRYKAVGLQFRHTDNINYFLKCLESERLPLTFLPETTDIYDKKNMPRLIYCIHALSKHLFKYGKAPPMPDLYGKVNFSDEEIDTVTKELQKHDIQMPAFQKIGGLLTNSITTNTATLHDAVIAINQAVIDNDNDKILQKLQGKEMQLSNVKPAYIEKYSKTLAEAKAAKTETALNKSLNDSYVADEYDELLTQAEIQGHINYVNASCALELVVSSLSHDNAEIIAALKVPILSFKNIFSENVEDYKEQLTLMLNKFVWSDVYLSESIQYWTDMFQKAIDKGNENAQLRHEREETIKRLNMALESADKREFYEILQTPCLNVSHCIDEFAVPLYYQEMKEDHIESEINISYEDLVVSIPILSAVAAITKAVDTGNPDFVYEKLSNPDAHLTGLDEFNKVKYARALTRARQAKLRVSQQCSTLTYSDIHKCIESVNVQCDEGFEVIGILQQINRAVAANDHEGTMKAVKIITEKFDIPIYRYDAPFYLKLLKKRLLEKESDESELWLDDVKTIAKKVSLEIQEMQGMIMFLCDINTYVGKNNMMEALNCLKMLGIPEKCFNEKCKEITENFKGFTEECLERCFLALQQLRRRKREAYSCPYICYTTNGGNKIYVDLKGGTYEWERPRNFSKTYLLTMDDISETIKSIAEKREEDYMMCDEKLLTKFQACIRGYSARKRIADRFAYFYEYDNLKKIITLQAWWRGVTQRKEYRRLLQKRRQNVLLHQSKFSNAKTNKDNKSDRLNRYKKYNGQASLKQIVGPLIEKVLEERDLCIETNPVDIYKLWRNQLEMECGQSLDMPHAVSQEQALKHKPVQESLTRAINQLKKISLEFLNRITQSRDLIPYGMLYVSKVLYNTLIEKFSHAPEKDILKAVGNLIYYHFINAAIVAPDTFDIVTLPVDRTLSSCQRKNLASIAKVLQFSTSKKGFGEEAPHLECLNQFIIACHERFKDFFRYCCQVEDLEEHFDIHEYTEATLIQNPEICISLQEVCEMHALLLNYEDQIAPDPSDPLHDLLDELGPAPTVASLLGVSKAAYDANLARYSKQEVCLVLTNKFQVPRNDDTNLSNLFVKAKELLVSVIPFLKRSTLVESLETTSSPMCVKLFDYFDYSSVSPTVRESSFINDCKMQLRAYLNKLELEGWISRADGYQTIVTAIARDICNKNKYRVARDKELQTLRATKVRLDEKTRYYQEQVGFYNEYIKGCLKNLHSGKSSLRAYQAAQKDMYTQCKLRSKLTVKYSAWKLQEKGVLMEVDQALSPTEMKNVTFEISPTEHSGVFAVRCKFMGVELEKLDISIQELLELQYEGRPCMDMFGRAKINVNLLLYLLNRKFYGKKS
ncbi:PREDICTED: ras GTPase-activating-like protein IQGAP1 [Vollenhovia emeryi]|uniref:ras GTPase-activating-like protein IQGAP1 n=1 Tax=Vollenhovia emeryi TaxID=411798 RepID=UPI0005F4F8E7|nr:PREDICTED: ras GTPase-activating-like protein IQGAP1 [Vollenhovia emeryi]